MKEEIINGEKYKLPNELNPFKKELYVHLINWKWKYITKEPGKYSDIEYDAILPESVRESMPHIFESLIPYLKEHQVAFPFKIHPHFFHMSSSQAANINLFLPVLLAQNVNEILRLIIPDFQKLATDYLYRGFRIEFWDGNSDKEKGLLKDHSATAGTDSDIAIAYYNNDNELCLWLIEHKLTEDEFTECGGFKSKGRDKSKHLCEKIFNDILENKNLCYYHDVSKYKYWVITEENKSFFPNANGINECPFKGGLNQLWRNQLLGFAIEKDNNQPFKKVNFSVVKHPENNYLNDSISKYKTLINNNPKFSVFNSLDVINAAESVNDPSLNNWIKWYKELYKI